MWIKEWVSALAIGLTVYAFLPYGWSVLREKVRPHVFSWVIWGATTCVVFLAQWQAQGGAGAWPIGVSGVLSGLIAGLAYLKRADCSITASDWAFLLAAFTALPLWAITADPTSAVVVLTIVDLLGFGPTFRKAYGQPQSESPVFFGVFAVRNALVLLALEHYSLATALFPAATGIACLLLIGIILVRRRRVLAA